MKHQRRNLTKRELAAITSKRGGAVRRIAAQPRPGQPSTAHPKDSRRNL